jgi:hypothetical protein
LNHICLVVATRVSDCTLATDRQQPTLTVRRPNLTEESNKTNNSDTNTVFY